MRIYSLILLVFLASGYYFAGQSLGLPSISSLMDSSPRQQSDPKSLSALKVTADSSGIRVAEMTGDRFVFSSHENQAEYKKVGEFSEDYRVFGVTVNKLENSPVNHVAAFLMVAPLQEVRKIAARDGCERAAVSQARVLPVIIAHEDVASTLADYVGTGGELAMSGSVLGAEKHLFNGRELPPQPPGTDLSKIYLLESLSKPAAKTPGIELSQVANNTSAPPLTHLETTQHSENADTAAWCGSKTADSSA